MPTHRVIDVLEGPAISQPSARAGAHTLYIGNDTFQLTFSNGIAWAVTRDYLERVTEAQMAAITSTENKTVRCLENETLYELMIGGKAIYPLEAHTSVQSATGANDIWWAIGGKYAVLRWIYQDTDNSSSTSSGSLSSISSVSGSNSSGSLSSKSSASISTGSSSTSSGGFSESSIPVSQSTPSSQSSSLSSASLSSSYSTPSSISTVGYSVSTGSS